MNIHSRMRMNKRKETVR